MAGDAEPSDNLYVQGLPANTDDDLVRSIFGAGVTQCKVLPSKPGQQTRVALVRFSTIEEASQVRQTIDGVAPPGMATPLNIRFAGKPGGGGGGGGGGQQQGWGKSSGKGWSSDVGGGTPYGSQSNNPPSDNLYVSGLPAGVDQDFLMQLFSPYGAVKQCKVLPGPTETTPCKALVRFMTVEEAVAVKENVNGCCVQGCDAPISVDFAIQKQQQQQPQQDQASWSPGPASPVVGKGGWGMSTFGSTPHGGGKGGGKDSLGMDSIVKGFQALKVLPGQELSDEDNCLFVAGLPPDCDDIHMYKLFAPFGGITPTGVTAMKHPDGNCKGFGFVNYLEPDSVLQAYQALNGAQLPNGNVLRVLPKQPKKNGASKGGGAITPEALAAMAGGPVTL